MWMYLIARSECHWWVPMCAFSLCPGRACIALCRAVFLHTTCDLNSFLNPNLCNMNTFYWNTCALPPVFFVSRAHQHSLLVSHSIVSVLVRFPIVAGPRSCTGKIMVLPLAPTYVVWYDAAARAVGVPLRRPLRHQNMESHGFRHSRNFAILV